MTGAKELGAEGAVFAVWIDGEGEGEGDVAAGVCTAEDGAEWFCSFLFLG